jgi:hypothetical protein
LLGFGIAFHFGAMLYYVWNRLIEGYDSLLAHIVHDPRHGDCSMQKVRSASWFLVNLYYFLQHYEIGSPF